MAKNTSTIHFFCYTTSPYSRLLTTGQYALIPESPPYVTGGIRSTGGGDLFYFSDILWPPPLDSYRRLTLDSAYQGTATASVVCKEDTLLIARFLTEDYIIEGILSGLWNIYAECKETTYGSGCPDYSKRIFAKIYKYSDLGVETLLGETGKAMVTPFQGFRTLKWSASGSIVYTDRILVKIYAQWEEIGVTI